MADQIVIHSFVQPFLPGSKSPIHSTRRGLRLSLPPARCNGDLEPRLEKAQCDRLEGERKTEKGLRSQWWACQRAMWEDAEDEKEDEGWEGVSGHWDSDKGKWSQEDWQGSTGARGSSDPPPPEPTAEPTASSRPKAIVNCGYPKRTHGEDHIALRASAMTPSSFQPQRHVAMALGRPVIVLSGV